MRKRDVLRLIAGWTWGTMLLVAGLFVWDRRGDGVTVGLAVASMAAGFGVFWTLVADPLCPRRYAWLARGLELLAVAAVLTGGSWSLWMVSTQ